MAIKPIHNETELLIAIEKGCEKAFEEIFMAYHNQLASYVILLTESRELTEEIIQDVFIKIWNDRENLHQINRFTSYLFILTKNHTLNAIRKIVNDREKKIVYNKLIHFEQSLSPVDDQKEKDFYNLIDKAVIQLPPQQKKVFVLRMQGLKNQQIASEMQISTESVKKYQQWALKSVINYVKICNGSVLIFLIFKVDLAAIHQIYFDS